MEIKQLITELSQTSSTMGEKLQLYQGRDKNLYLILSRYLGWDNLEIGSVDDDTAAYSIILITPEGDSRISTRETAEEFIEVGAYDYISGKSFPTYKLCGDPNSEEKKLLDFLAWSQGDYEIKEVLKSVGVNTKLLPPGYTKRNRVNPQTGERVLFRDLKRWAQEVYPE